MTEEFTDRIRAHAKRTSRQLEPAEKIIDLVCAEASMDDPDGYKAVFNTSFPLLDYVAKSLGLPTFTAQGTESYVSIRKEIIPDLEVARNVFLGFGVEEAHRIVPDWRGKGLHTEILIQNMRDIDLYSEKGSALQLAIAFSEDGEYLNGEMFASPPVEKTEGDWLRVKNVKKQNVPLELTIDILRIILHQIVQVRSPRPASLTSADSRQIPGATRSRA